MKKLIASICLTAALIAPAAAAGEAVKVKSRISFSFTPPFTGVRSVTISGQVKAKKGCRAHRSARIGALSGGSAPPTQLFRIRRDGSFTTIYTVAGPGRVDVFTALLPSKRTREGVKILCRPAIFQASIPFS